MYGLIVRCKAFPRSELKSCQSEVPPLWWVSREDWVESKLLSSAKNDLPPSHLISFHIYIPCGSTPSKGMISAALSRNFIIAINQFDNISVPSFITWTDSIRFVGSLSTHSTNIQCSDAADALLHLWSCMQRGAGRRRNSRSRCQGRQCVRAQGRICAQGFNGWLCLCLVFIYWV